MVWSVYGKELESGDLTSADVSQQVVMPDREIVLKAVRAWFILVNDPDFTNLYCKIYGDRNGSPAKLLYTSDKRTKAEILTTEPNGNIETYFEFNDVNLNANDTYHIVYGSDSYNPVADDSYIALRVAWPDPVYTANYTPTFTNLLVAPYFVSSLVGAEL